MPEPTSPTVRRRRLAAELRRLRESADLTGDHVAEQMRWSASKVSRIENGHTVPREPELRKLLALYQLGEAEIQKLADLAREAVGKGWWEAYAGTLPASHLGFMGLEAEASTEFVWAPEVISGLLQTKDYAREVIREHAQATSTVPPGEIERRVEARAVRQKILERDPPFTLSVVLDESVLLRRIGSNNNVMKMQLNHLLEVCDHPNVSLRVLALDALHPIATGAFVFLQFMQIAGAGYHDIAYIESLTEGSYVEAERDTYQYHLAFDRLAALSLSDRESQDLIANRRSTWQ